MLCYSRCVRLIQLALQLRHVGLVLGPKVGTTGHGRVIALHRQKQSITGKAPAQICSDQTMQAAAKLSKVAVQQTGI